MSMHNTHNSLAAIDLRHLRTFLALAQVGNFSETGQRLGLSQSAVSRHIRSLAHPPGPGPHRETNEVRAGLLPGAGRRESRAPHDIGSGQAAHRPLNRVHIRPRTCFTARLKSCPSLVTSSLYSNSKNALER